MTLISYLIVTVHTTELKSEVGRLLTSVEICWEQNSIMAFLKEGDRNTKFFCKVASENLEKIL